MISSYLFTITLKHPVSRVNHITLLARCVNIKQVGKHISMLIRAEECEYKTIQKSNLITHQRSFHIGEKFQYSDCDYESSYKTTIVSHQKLFILARNWNIQSVIIRHLGKIIL